MALRAFRLRLTMTPRVTPAVHSGRPIRAAPTASHTGDNNMRGFTRDVGDAIIGVPLRILCIAGIYDEWHMVVIES